jgi:multicomponent Na+:H+ antiporter subunit G
MLHFIGTVLAFAGAASLIVSAIGIVRMPDIFSRMHAGTKASTLGILLIIAAAACFQPAWSLKLLLLALFVLMTNPLSSSALALASYKMGVPHAGGEMDDLQRDGLYREPRPLSPGDVQEGEEAIPTKEES